VPGPDAEKWNAIYQAGGHDRPEPARVLVEYVHLLPVNGRALDVACGTGANALFLALKGLDTSAWDISTEAIKRLEEKAGRQNLKLDTRICDVTESPPPEKSFDVIMVSYFLERTLIPSLVRALRDNGLLFYQTYSKERVSDKGPHNDNYRLGSNELLQLCRDLHILLYREEGVAGDIRHGFRDEVMLIGQRR
jgi:Methylase involved in ubiquinone/menaquinone biosynthesis